MKKSDDPNGYMREYMHRVYEKRISKAIEDAGGKCVACGSTDRLQFDHIDPETKVANITTMYSASAEKFDAELRKCQLLCGSCHNLKTLKENDLVSAPGTHGTLSAYRVCGPPKCDLCREANNKYVREWKLAHGRGTGQPQKPRPEHGTKSAYQRCGPPKCELCKKANTEAHRRYRESREKNEPSDS